MSPRKNPFIVLLLALTLATACHREKKEEPTKPQSSAPAPSANEAKPAAPAAPATNLSTPTDAVKTFFDAISKEQYDVAWSSLSKASQDKFISMVAEDEKLDPAKVRDLFEQNQMPIRLGFWRSSRNSSKIDVFAPGATYKVTQQDTDRAEVELTSGQVTLKSKAINENGQWKMGYVETFLP